MGFKIHPDGTVEADTLQETLAYVRGDKIVRGVGRYGARQNGLTLQKLDDEKILKALARTKPKRGLSTKEIGDKTGYKWSSVYGRLKLHLGPKGKVSSYSEGRGRYARRLWYRVGK